MSGFLEIDLRGGFFRKIGSTVCEIVSVFDRDRGPG